MPCSHLMSCETGNGGGGVGSGVELPHGTNHPQLGLLASSKSQSTPRNFLSQAPLSGLVVPWNRSCFPALAIGTAAVEPERTGDPDQDIRILRLEHRRAQAAAISADIQSRKTALLVKRLIHAVEVWDDPITYIC